MKLEEVMKKFSAAISMAVLALMSLITGNTALADIAPDNVQGNWTIYSTNTGNGDTVVKHVQIAQYGDRITGYFEGPVQSGPIQGEIKGHNIRFSTVTRNFRDRYMETRCQGPTGFTGSMRPGKLCAPPRPRH
jgi:hypothetical protein